MGIGDWDDLEPIERGATWTKRGDVSLTIRVSAKGKASAFLYLRESIRVKLAMQNHRCVVRAGKGLFAHQISVIAHSTGAFELLPVAVRGRVQKGETTPKPDMFYVRVKMAPSWPKQAISVDRTFQWGSEVGKPVLLIDLPPQFWPRGAVAPKPSEAIKDAQR